MKPRIGLLAALLLAAVLPWSKTASAQGFNSVWSRTGTDVIAVGDNGESYRSLDAGLKWTESVIGSPSLNLRDVTGRGLTMLAVGDGGMIWRSTNAGGAWASTTAPGATPLRAAAMASDAVWVVGGNGGMLLRTTDAGANWVSVTSGTAQTLYALHFTDALNGWAAGAAGTLLATTDGGANWNTVAIATSNALYSVDQQGSKVWVVGANGTAWRSIDGGANFNPVPLKLDARSDVRSVVMKSPDSLWIAGGGGFIRFSNDGGATWTFQQHTLQAPITRLAFNGTGVWATNSANRVVMSSINGGTTWRMPTGATVSRSWGATPRFLINGQTRGSGFALNPVDKNTLYCGIGSNVARSRDEGQSWQVASTFPAGYTKCNAFVVSPKDSNLWLAALSGGTVADRVYRTTDGGSSWNISLTHEFGEYGIPLEINPDRPDTVYFGGEFNATGAAQVPLYRTQNFGASWDSLANALFRSPCDIVALPETTGVILIGDGVTGSGRGRFLKSSNNGLTFAIKDSIGSSEIPGMAVSRLRPNAIFATNWSSGGVERSTDYGNTWPVVNNTVQSWGIDIAKDDPNLVVFGQYSTPYYTSLSFDGGTTYTIIPPTSGFNNNYGIYVRDRATIFAEQSGGIWKLQENYSYTPSNDAQSLQLNSPQDGDVVAGGSVVNINWLETAIALVRIEYRPSAAAAWQPVATVSGSLGSYAWHVPTDMTSDARIRISDMWDGFPEDEITAGFTIRTPRLVASPVALDFGFHRTGTATVLPLTIQNTGNAPLIVSSIATATGVYAMGRTTLTLAPAQQDTVGVWFMPVTEGTFPDTVMITSNDPVTATFARALTGQAAGPAVTLAAPNGGEAWAAGTTQAITWSSAFVSTVNLDFRVAPDSAWVPIASGLPSLPASYSWTIPYLPTATATVRASGPGVTPLDLSDAEFTILSPRFAAAPDTLRLPAIQVGFSGGDPLRIDNTGNAPLSITGITSSNPEFHVGRTSLVIAAGESDTVGVYFEPTAAGPQVTQLSIATDEPSSPHLRAASSAGVLSLAAPGENAVAFALGQNRPNPFAHATLIQYTLARESDVTLDVFDLRGQRVARLVNGRESAGRHEVSFGASTHVGAGLSLGRVPAGVYFYRLQAGALTATRKMLLVQ